MSIVTRAELYIQSLFKDKLSSSYLYHNLFHTQKVVQNVKELCLSENIENKTTVKLLLAAWFHDCGYITGKDNHEEMSLHFLKEFMQIENVNQNDFDEISSYILATKLDFEPKTIEEKIIKDADYYHFGTEGYLESSENLRKEWQLTCSKEFSDLEWYKISFDFMQNKHQFYTDFAKKNYQPIKEQNIQKVMEKIHDIGQSKEKKKDKKKKKENEKAKYDRGVETMFRTTLNNHTRLSEIADNKANIYFL